MGQQKTKKRHLGHMAEMNDTGLNIKHANYTA